MIVPGRNLFYSSCALCALLIFIPSARQELKPQKYPLFSITYRIYDTLKQRVMANKALLVAADKAAFQLVRLRLSSAEVKSRHVNYPIQTCSDAIVRGG